jgi:hypothetical protein
LEKEGRSAAADHCKVSIIFLAELSIAFCVRMALNFSTFPLISLISAARIFCPFLLFADQQQQKNLAAVVRRKQEKLNKLLHNNSNSLQASPPLNSKGKSLSFFSRSLFFFGFPRSLLWPLLN